MLTRYELRAALKCLGISRSREEVDALFLGILEMAIEDGELGLPFRCVQKALLHQSDGERVSTWITAQQMGRQGLQTRLERAEADCAKAQDEAAAARAAEESATSRAAKAEAALAAATKQAAAKQAELSNSNAEKAGQADGLRHYLQHVEAEKARFEQMAEQLAQQVHALKRELDAARRELAAADKGGTPRRGSVQQRPPAVSPSACPAEEELHATTPKGTEDDDGDAEVEAIHASSVARHTPRRPSKAPAATSRAVQKGKAAVAELQRRLREETDEEIVARLLRDAGS